MQARSAVVSCLTADDSVDCPELDSLGRGDVEPTDLVATEPSTNTTKCKINTRATLITRHLERQVD